MVPDTRMSLFVTITNNALKARARSSMKPTRIRMCHSLVMNYGLYKRMEIFVSARGIDLFLPHIPSWFLLTC
jgi:histone deacetylase 1/2